MSTTFDELSAAFLRLGAARERKAQAAQAYGVAHADEVVAYDTYLQLLTSTARSPEDADERRRFRAWLQAQRTAKVEP